MTCDSDGVSKEMPNSCEENGIQIKFTPPFISELNGHIERMNRTLTEKCRSMLIENGVSKELWEEYMQNAAYLINRLPTSALDRVIAAKLWYGNKPDVNKLRVFGCKAFLLKPKHKRDKLDTKSDEYIFVGYASQGYRLFDTTKRNIVVGRNIIFQETPNLLRKNETYVEDDVITTKHTKYYKKIFIEEENMSHDSLTLKNEEYNEDKDLNKTFIDKSTRVKNPPFWIKDYDTSLTMVLSVESVLDGIPKSYKEAVSEENKENLLQAMKEEIETHNENKTWTLVDNPENHKIISSEWVFTMKKNQLAIPYKYKAKLVAKGYSQTYGIETYAPVANMVTVRVFLSIINFQKLFIHQMDVKTAFLNGYLSENINMMQPEGF